MCSVTNAIVCTYCSASVLLLTSEVISISICYMYAVPTRPLPRRRYGPSRALVVLGSRSSCVVRGGRFTRGLRLVPELVSINQYLFILYLSDLKWEHICCTSRSVILISEIMLFISGFLATCRRVKEAQVTHRCIRPTAHRAHTEGRVTDSEVFIIL